MIQNSKYKIQEKGFTLIELLTVIAIIGILSSVLLVQLGGARAKARDSRRMGDLKALQQSIELYYSKCNHYPGDASCNKSTISEGYNTNSNLRAALTGANIGVSKVPTDPSTGQYYGYYSSNALGEDNQRYVLYAKLETETASNDPNRITGTYGALTCDSAKNYCIGVGY